MGDGGDGGGVVMRRTFRFNNDNVCCNVGSIDLTSSSIILLPQALLVI